MDKVRGWKTIPVPLTDEMEVAFAEAWYSKRRTIDEVDMADAWEAACDAAPPAPDNPRTQSLARQVDRLTSMLRSTGESRDKLLRANEELISLLRESLEINGEGFYAVTMDPGYRSRVCEAVQKHEPRRPNAHGRVVEEAIENLQHALNAERAGSEDIRATLYDAFARTEAERDAALAELIALQAQGADVKLMPVHRGSEVYDPQVTFSPGFARVFDGMAAGTEVSLYARAAPHRFRECGLAQLAFPTMLRQMWSGSAVQEWIKEQGPLYVWPSLQRAAFQTRVAPWVVECFGQTITGDKQERNHRFLEEALELVQACGGTAGDSHELVDYVFGRPVGEKSQEVGGVMVTLAALCHANHLNMHQAGETELDRISQPEVMGRIRSKQKAKPAIGPLPIR